MRLVCGIRIFTRFFFVCTIFARQIGILLPMTFRRVQTVLTFCGEVATACSQVILFRSFQVMFTIPQAVLVIEETFLFCSALTQWPDSVVLLAVKGIMAFFINSGRLSEPRRTDCFALVAKPFCYSLN